MNTTEIKIEKGIPIPPAGECVGRRGGKWVDLLRSMEIGDSVLLTVVEYSSFNLNVRRLGWKVCSRQEPDGIHRRLWLVEKGKATP